MGKTCCFIEQNINRLSPREIEYLEYAISYHIKDHNVDTFIFGGYSDFTNLCYLTLAKVQKRFPTIKKIYFYLKSNKESTNQYLFDETKTYSKAKNEVYFESKIRIIKEMIDNSEYVFIYQPLIFNEDLSYTSIAKKYSLTLNKEPLNICKQ